MNAWKHYALLLLLTLLTLGESKATSFYVRNGGNDNLSGTSDATAWASLSKVNATTFNQGDVINFKRGSVWTGMLWPKGAGAASNLITIVAYGTGARPRINRAGGIESGISTAFHLFNQRHWEVNDLELTNSAGTAGSRRGAYIKAENAGTVDDIALRNLYVHNVTGDLDDKLTGGIIFNITDIGARTKFDDILVEGCTIKAVDRTGLCNASAWSTRNVDWTPSTNVRFRNNILEDIGGDGIVARVATGAVVEFNTVNRSSNRAPNPNAAIWCFNADNTLIQFNEAYNTQKRAGNGDGLGFDLDYLQMGTIVQYNYSHDNVGGFLLITTQAGAALGTKNCIARYNISENDGGSLLDFRGPTENTLIYNNTMYRGAGFTGAPIRTSDDVALPISATFYNNIFHLVSAGAWDTNFSGSRTFDYNTFYGVHSAGEPSDAHKSTANPLFVSPGSGGIGRGTVSGYKLQAGSPALNTGRLITSNGGQDYFGNAVSATATPNRGAYDGGGIAARSMALATAVQSEASRVFSVAPNPNNGNFQVHLCEQNTVGLLTVRDPLGRVVHSQILSGASTHPIVSVDAANLASGLYWVAVQTKNGVAKQVIVINR